MFKLKVINVESKEAESEVNLELPSYGERPENFSKWEYYLQNAEFSNRRTANPRVKRRGEVSGGGKKPWKQKGTGFARQGSIRAPQWTGGGTVFGPNDRDREKKVNKKLWSQYLFYAFVRLLEEERVVLVNSKISNIKTSIAKEFISSLPINNYETKKRMILLFANKTDLSLAFRNLPYVSLCSIMHMRITDFSRRCIFIFSVEDFLSFISLHKIGEIK